MPGSFPSRVWLPSILLLLYGLVASAYGLSSDSDSALLQRAAQAWLDGGEYMRSRTSGFPLYEALLALVLASHWPLYLINLLSLAMALGVLRLSAGIAVQAAGRPLARGLAPWLLMTQPLFLIASAEPMETMLSLLLALTLVARGLSEARPGLAQGAFAVLLVLTRLDAALLVVAVAWASAITGGRRAWPWAAAWLAATGLAALCAYLALNQGWAFLNAQTMGFDTVWRRFARALASTVNALQLTGLLALLTCLRSWRGGMTNSSRMVWLDQLLLAAALLYGCRFLALPDEVFYLVIPVMLLLIRLAIVADGWTRAQVAGLMLLGALQCLLSLSLFVRSPGALDAIRFRPALNPGPLAQELRIREVFAALRDEQARQRVSCALFPDCPALQVSHTAPYLTTADNTRAAVSARYLYVFFSGRYPRLVDRGFREIRVCQEEVVPGPAWRIWQPAMPYSVVEAVRDGHPLRCETLVLRRP